MSFIFQMTFMFFGLVFFSDDKMKTSDTAKHRWVATSGGNESWQPTGGLLPRERVKFKSLQLSCYYNKFYYIIIL